MSGPAKSCCEVGTGTPDVGRQAEEASTGSSLGKTNGDTHGIGQETVKEKTPPGECNNQSGHKTRLLIGKPYA